MKIGIAIHVDQASGGIYQYTMATLKALNSLTTDDQFVILVPEHFSIPFDDFKPPVWHVSKMPSSILTRNEDRQPHLCGDGLDLEHQGINPAAHAFFSGEGIDLLIYPAPFTLSFECGIAYIMAVHDLQHRLQPEFPEVSAGMEWNYREYLFRNGIRYAKAIMADSEIGCEDILNNYGNMIDPRRVYSLPFVPSYYPGSLTIGTSDQKKARDKYHLPEQFLFYPAQFWMHKNHARLIHAIALLRTRFGIDMPLVLAGSKTGPPHEARETIFGNAMLLAKQLGVDDLISYLGYVPDEDMPVLYSLATALVMPTFFGPTNIPILEAWAFNCPVVTSDIRGIREQVYDAAILVDPADSSSIADGIFKLLKDDSYRLKIMETGQKRLNSYTLEDFSRRLHGIIQDVIPSLNRI